MFLFGHIGIGRTLVGRWRARLPAAPLIVGTLLPDIIDKPLYYARIWPFVSCTRTFGHTGLLLLALLGAASVRRSRTLIAIAAGLATHLLLDCVLDWPAGGEPSSAWTALTWPLSGGHFVSLYFPSIRSHAAGLWSPPIVISEVVGLLLLGWELTRRRGAASLAAGSEDSIGSGQGREVAARLRK